MSGPPLVSVIMSAYNAGPWLQPAIESIRAQTERAWELVAVDDASTDGTGEQLASWADREPRIRLLRNGENRGAARSLNRAAAAAHGRWLARMDADDVAHPERLAAQLRLASEGQAVSGVTCYVDVLEGERVRAGARGVGFDWELLPWFSLFYNRVGGGGQLFCARETLLGVGGFDEAITYGEDRELWLRLMQRAPLGLVRRPLYRWRSSADSMTKRQHRRFRYSDDSLSAGTRAIQASCGVAVPSAEAVALRDFWLRFDDGTQDWAAVQRRLLELAAAFRGLGGIAPPVARLRGSIAEGWLGHALRAASRGDRRKCIAHLRRAREAAGHRWPLAFTRWTCRLAQVRGRADRLI